MKPILSWIRLHRSLSSRRRRGRRRHLRIVVMSSLRCFMVWPRSSPGSASCSTIRYPPYIRSEERILYLVSYLFYCIMFDCHAIVNHSYDVIICYPTRSTWHSPKMKSNDAARDRSSASTIDIQSQILPASIGRGLCVARDQSTSIRRRRRIGHRK